MRSKLAAWLQLLRLSNVLTPVADVWMGIVVMTGTLAPAGTTAALTLASVCLYLSGMVLNDVFDADRDAIERPSRPIPSGAVSLAHATVVGWGLMLAGLTLAWRAATLLEATKTLVIAVALAASIILYNYAFKKRFLGPLFMGLCRGLNVMLGMTAFGVISHLKSAPKPPVTGWFIIGGVILYVTGLTYFARDEATSNKRLSLFYSVVLSLLGLGLIASGPGWIDAYPTVPWPSWWLLWSVIALFVGRRYVAALMQPTPKHIQSAVGNAIQAIILIDAALAWGYAGQFWGLAILALWPPTVLLARFIPQT